MASIEFMFIADDGYSAGLLTFLYSLTVNGGGLEDILLTALCHRGLAPLSVKTVAQARRLFPGMMVRDCSDLYGWAEERSGGSAASLVSLLKLEAFRGSRADYVVYIDTDMLVLKPFLDVVGELQHEEMVVGAVENHSFALESRIYDAGTFPCNTGFLVVDCARARAISLYEELALEVWKRRVALLKMPAMVDQPIINAVLGRTIKNYLAYPMLYNFRHRQHFEYYLPEIKLLHFINRTLTIEKPWNILDENSRDAMSKLWWTYMRGSRAVV